jgi:hypothetical protein
MGGNFLTHLDLPAPSQIWTIRDVSKQLVGGVDTKVCVLFSEHAKPLGLNKINLRTIAQAFGVDSNSWLGRQLEVHKDMTQFQGKTMPCVRVRIPMQPPEPMQYAPQPVAAPSQYAPQPVAAPQPVQYAPPQQQPAFVPVQPVPQPQQPQATGDQALWDL